MEETQQAEEEGKEQYAQSKMIPLDIGGYHAGKTAMAIQAISTEADKS